MLENEINLAVIPCDLEDTHYTMGLKNVKGGVEFSVDKGVPTLKVSFKSTAQVQGAKKIMVPENVVYDDIVSPQLLKATEDALEERFRNLIETCIQADCDILGIKKQLHKNNYKYYEAFKDDVLQRMEVEYKIDVKSLN